MSDFFMPTKDSGYWNRKQEEQKTQQAENAGQNDGGYWNKKTESFNQAKAQHYENWNRYGVEVPDEYYEVFNQIIGKAETPEQAQEEAYRIGSAVKYAKMYGMSLDEAYKNVDAFNEAQFSNVSGQKGRFEALSDMFTLGTNNVELGKLGNKLMIAQRDGDTELAEALKAEIGAIQEQNVLLQDNAPRSWVMQALEAGAQSLPFTGAVAGAGIIGNFIAPAVGTGTAFLASSYLSSGQEYIDSLANGATPETARTIAMLSGGIQGLIEADLGITSGIVKGTARVMGKEAAEKAAKKAVEEIGQKVFKRFHFGAGKKLVLNYLSQQGKNVLGEGTEEFLQELTSIAGQEVMAAIDGYDIPDDDAKNIVKQVTEAFRGGVLGALSLGFIPAGLNTAADVKQFKKVKEEAEAVESPEVFHNLVKDNPIFDGMGEENLKATTREIWDRAQQRKEEALNEAAKEILETTDFGEGSEEHKVNEQGEEEPLDPVARNKEGRLDIQDEKTTNEDGTINGTFRAGDRTKKTDNRYGYISYTANKADKTVEINAFKMADGREGLRGELFDEFSRKYAGYKVEWRTTDKVANKYKQTLIANNPNGKKAGLSYYSEEDISDIQTRKRVMSELKKNVYHIEKVTDINGKERVVKTKLTNEELAAGVALLESAAKRMGMRLSDYVDKTFGETIFGDIDKFNKSVKQANEEAIAQNTPTGKHAGAVKAGIVKNDWKKYGQEVKAVIYAGKNTDFSTWVHELAHIFQNQLEGDLKAQAEKAFNVIGGDWDKSTFTLVTGETVSSREAFAYGFQDWLKTGKAESEELKNIFQKFAQFLVRAYNALGKHIDFTPEIEAVYNQLLGGDDSILAKAAKAVEEEDRAYRAKMKTDEEAMLAAEKKAAEDEKARKKAEREENAEVTEYAEEKADKAEEDNEVTNEKGKENVSAVDNALKDLNLTDEQKEKVADVLKDPDETQQAKASTIVDAASESAYKNSSDMSFQETISDDELKEIISNVKHSEQRLKYIDEYYTNRKSEFETKVYTSSDGKITGKLEVYKNRVFSQKEIDDSLLFVNKGIEVTLLPEGERQNEKNPDVLFNHSTLAEYKNLISDKVNTIANEIKKAANKKNSEVITVFFEDKAKSVNYEDIIEKINFKKQHGDFKGEYDELLFVKDGEISRVNKNTASPTKADTYRNSNIQQESDVVKQNNENPLLFQEVYHGSPHNFETFSTEKIGAGQGAQSFGWGLYFTNQKEIAKFYADNLSNSAARLSLLAKNDYLKSRKKSLKDVENREKYEARIYKNINHFNKELKQAQKEKDEEQIKFYQKLIDDSVKQLDEKERLSLVESFKKDIEKTNNEIAELKESMKNNRNLYTVEIPDDGYLQWDKEYDVKNLEGLKKALYDKILDEYFGGDKESAKYEVEGIFFDGATGEDIYHSIQHELESDKAASLFLKDLGYVGIDYPANSLTGGNLVEGERNYVIFDDETPKIVNHLLYQTMEEVYTDALEFDTWEDFMEFYEQHGKRLEEDTAVPYTADANWYKDTWNMAQSVKKDEEQQTEQKATEEEESADTPELMDDIFISYVRKDPAVLDNFLKMVAAINKEDLSSEEWAHMDEKGASERERIEILKEFIGYKLNDFNWRTAIKAVEAGKELDSELRKRVMTEMTDRYKVREFRDIYASIMQQKRFRVNELDTRAAELYRQYQKHEKRYYDIAMPDELEYESPQRLKNLAEELHNHDMKVKIKGGVIPLNNDLDNYFKSLEKKDEAKQKELDRLNNKVNTAYMKIANEERKLLIRTHEKLLDLQNRKDNVSKTVQDRIANPLKKGLSLTDRYQRELEDMETSYHEVFRKFSDLKDSLEITEDLKEILDAQEQAAKIKAEVQEITEEKNRVEEVKKIRLGLVKRTLRKVDLGKVDYATARKIIAIQRMIEPNIIGGINRWIGRKNPALKAVLAQILTDSEYKEQILRYLRAQKNDTQVFQDFYKSIENATKLEDFESWGVAEQSYAIKHLPKENWVRSLNLADLAEERRKSLQLDITTKEVERPVYDEDGYPIKDANGEPQTEKTYVLEFSNEIGQMVKDAVGEELFDKIVNQSFVSWTTDDLFKLAQVVNNLYKEGVELRKAKILARKREAQNFRKMIEDAARNTGIVINDDDPPEIKAKKEKRIAKILGKSKDFKGTEAAKDNGFLAKLDRLFNGFGDANVLRVSRVIDGYKEGANYQLLYRMENDCFNAKQRSIVKRSEAVKGVMKDNKINEFELASMVEVEELGTKFSVDELLFFLAADKDFEEDETKLEDGLTGLAANDDFAPTSRNAVMFGVMGSDSATQEQKEAWAELDKDLKDAEMEDLINRTPGAQQYISLCKERWATVLKAANKFLEENPKYNALMEVIQDDYADQYERMNEVSINEFNLPVNRVNCYVPLVRLEANGETNEKQVQEDLLRAYGQDRAGVNKGMTQQRKKISPLNQKPVQTGLFKTWANSVDRTEHFIAYASYVKLLRDVYTGRDSSYTKGVLESRYGKGVVDYIEKYISEVANPKAGKVAEAGSEFLRLLRGRTAPAYLGWKLSGIVKQGLTSPWPYMQFVNPAEYLAACAECLTPGKKIYDTIKEKSVFMKTRSFDPIKDLVDEVQENAKNKLDKNWSKITAMGMQGLEWIDWACVAPGWYACYKKEYARLQKANEAKVQKRIEELTEKNAALDPDTEGYLTEDKIKAKAYQEYTDDLELLAIQYADDCTRQCQPSSRLTDLAPLFKNSSEAMKAFLQFQTSLNVIWQNIRYDIPYAVRQKEFERIAGGIIGYVMAGIFMNSVMDGLMEDDGEDRKELQALRNLIFYSTTQFTDAIPMIGSEITNTMDMLITGKRNFSQSGTDMTPSATKILNALTKATKGDFKKAAALTAEGIGLGLGAPVSGTKEIYKLLGKPFKEGDVNLKRGVGDVYGLAGDILGE